MRRAVRSADRVVAWVGAAVLLALHLDFWRPRRDVLYFGWLPEELGYRVLWMLAASLYLFFFTQRVWRDDGGQAEDDAEPGEGRR